MRKKHLFTIAMCAVALASCVGKEPTTSKRTESAEESSIPSRDADIPETESAQPIEAAPAVQNTPVRPIAPKKFGTSVFGGQATMANSQPVVIASDQTAIPISGTVTATVNTASLATSAKQDTGNTSLGTIATNTTSIATAANQTTQTTSLNLLTQPKQTTAVTISDSTDTTTYCGKGIWVGVAGDVAVKMLSDSAATTLKNIPSGSFVPGQFLRIMSTNTTATNIICFGGTG